MKGKAKGREKEKCGIMSLYRLTARVCSCIRFSNVPPRSRITNVVSALLPLCLNILADHRWPLVKVYCTFHHGLQVAFSDDWIENRSFSIALLEMNVDRANILNLCAKAGEKDASHRLVPSFTYFMTVSLYSC